MTDSKLIVLYENIHPRAQEMFTDIKDKGHMVEMERGALTVHGKSTASSSSSSSSKLATASVLGIRSASRLTKEALKQASKLEAIGTYCIGYDMVDLEAATELAIPIFNSPFSSTRSVAELVIAQLINLSRGLMDNSMTLQQHGIWTKTSDDRREIRGKTLGIVGMGRIGSTVSILAESMGMHVIFYDTETRLEYGNAKRMTTLDACLSRADFVTLHVPLTPETDNMMNEARIAQMKPGSFLLNASRGKVVDIVAVVAALERRHLAGFYADVLPVEPKSNGPWRENKSSLSPSKENKSSSFPSTDKEEKIDTVTDSFGASSASADRVASTPAPTAIGDDGTIDSSISVVNAPTFASDGTAGTSVSGVKDLPFLQKKEEGKELSSREGQGEGLPSPIRRLAKMKNVILTCHIGGSTEEAQRAIAEDVTNKIIDFLTTGSTLGAVNLPQLSLPLKKSVSSSSSSSSALSEQEHRVYRVVNFHHNVPGALRDINKCLEEFNIVQQNLSTLGTVGYCIMDLVANSSSTSTSTNSSSVAATNILVRIEQAVERIRSLPQTIRCRFVLSC